MQKYRFNSVITLIGSVSFITSVSVLHIIQTDYDPFHQLMSELALGKWGGLMLLAFGSLALALGGALKILSSFGIHQSIKYLLAFASLFLMGAGVFTLGNAATLHISLVALAFILLVLSMYLVPRLIDVYQGAFITITCWGFGALTALFIWLGHDTIPIGLAQRLATASILLWLVSLAIFNLIKRGGQGA